jgi:hypothetical protein
MRIGSKARDMDGGGREWWSDRETVEWWSGGAHFPRQHLCRGPLPYAIRSSDLDMVAKMGYLVRQTTNFPTNLLNEKDRGHVSSLRQV